VGEPRSFSRIRFQEGSDDLCCQVTRCDTKRLCLSIRSSWFKDTYKLKRYGQCKRGTGTDGG